MICLQQTRHFQKTYKKLKANERSVVDDAIRAIAADPGIGESKKGDLAGVRVYKFPMLGRQTLLGYSYVEEQLIIFLLAVGPHENFFRDLKRD